MSQDIGSRLFDTFKSALIDVCLKQQKQIDDRLLAQAVKLQETLGGLGSGKINGDAAQAWLDSLDRLNGTIGELSEQLRELPHPEEELLLHFGALMEEIPERYSEEMAVQLYEAQKDDSASWRVQRFFLRRKVAWILWRHKDQTPQRRFDCHAFVRFYMRQPVLEAMWETLQQTRQQMAVLLQHIENEWTALLDRFGAEASEEDPKPQALSQKISEFKEQRLLQRDQLEETLAGFFEEARAKWGVAGTFLCPHRHFSSRKLHRRQLLLQKKQTRYDARWQKYWTAVLGDWQTNLRLGSLIGQTDRHWGKLSHTLENVFKKELTPPFAAISSHLKKSLKQFESDLGESKSGLRSQIVKQGKIIISGIRTSHLPLLLDKISQNKLQLALAGFEEGLKALSSNIPEKETIIKSDDLSVVPPHFDTETINLKDLVESDVIRPALRQLEQTQQRAERLQQRLNREISDVDQVVDFNFESALAMLSKTKVKDDALTKASDICIEGLERAINKVDDLQKLLESGADEIAQNSRASRNKIIERLLDLVDNAKIIELKIRLVRARTREKVRGTALQLWQMTKRSLPLVIYSLKKGWRWLNQKYNEFRKLTGLETSQKRVSEEATAFLLETESKINALPYVYQRLFQLDHTADKRFFAGREKEMLALGNGLKIWQKGQFACMALVGEKGCGKTSLLENSLSAVFEDYPVFVFTLQQSVVQEAAFCEQLADVIELSKKPKTLEEMEKAIAGLDEPAVIFLENMHHLFLRTTDGFDLLERFLLFISNTNNQLLWVASCTQYAWSYLDKLLNISDYFRRVLYLGDMPEKEIEAMIMKRHAASGYRLTLELPADIAKKSDFKKLRNKDEQQAYLRDYFFEQLCEIAEGNISIALMMWQRAIVRFDDEELIIDPDLDIDYSFLQQLPSEKMFTLAAILQHGAITVQQHSHIFRSAQQNSLLLLKSMADDGILIAEDGRFDIHHYLYRHVVRQLNSLNFIH